MSKRMVVLTDHEISTLMYFINCYNDKELAETFHKLRQFNTIERVAKKFTEAKPFKPQK